MTPVVKKKKEEEHKRLNIEKVLGGKLPGIDLGPQLGDLKVGDWNYANCVLSDFW